jgi:hypothetical protein
MTLGGKNPAQSDIVPSAILAWNFTFSSLSIPIFGKKTWWPYCDPNWSPPMSVCDTCVAPLGVLMSDSYVFSLRKFPSMAEWDGWRTGPWLERHTLYMRRGGYGWGQCPDNANDQPRCCVHVCQTHTHNTLYSPFYVWNIYGPYTFFLAGWTCF